MPFVYHGATFLEGKPKVDGGECARLVQHLLPWVGHTSGWRPGENVVELLAAGKSIEPETAIATFVNGQYPSGGHRHAALYLGANTSCSHDPKTGRCKLLSISIMDQWNAQAGHMKKDKISARSVYIYGKDAPYPISDNASMFYLIE
jgi:hypothetical protein